MLTQLPGKRNDERSGRQYRRSDRSQRGSAIIETGLILPVAILMVCGAMDLARVFYAGVVVANAARAGVQFGSFDLGKAGAINSMNSAAEADASGQGLSGVAVSSRTFCGCTTSMSEVSCSTATCSGATPAGYVETTATYTFTPMIPYPGMPGPIVISSSARFRAQ
jgi:Flp pilus assembly protein TadG